MSAELDFLTLWRTFAPDAPLPMLEYRFDKVRRWRFDFAWFAPVGGVAVEIDGGQHVRNGGRHNTDGDRWKMSTAASLGWVVLRFSPDMLREDPVRCVELTLHALEVARGRA